MIQVLTNEKKLIVLLAGGTGNQLFQLMACENMAHLYKREPFYSDHLLGGQRKLETEDAANKLGIKKIDVSQLSGVKLIEEKNMCYPPLFNIFPDYEILPNEDLILSGYFQNYRIHSSNGVKKLKEFAYKYVSSLSLSENNFIAIHLRELHATKGSIPLTSIDNLSLDYYKRALYLIEEELKLKREINIKKAYLFTDMFKDYSKSLLYYPLLNLLQSKGYQVINADKECENSLQVISLMSRAKFVVCSNSTFSWWGAYLSKGTRICPIFSMWETNLNTPDSWIQLYDGNKDPRTWHKLNVYKNGKIKTKLYSLNNVFFHKLKSVVKQKIFSKILGGLLNRYETLRIKSILS